MNITERMGEYFKIVDGFAPSMEQTTTEKVAYMYEDLADARALVRELVYALQSDTGALEAITKAQAFMEGKE